MTTTAETAAQISAILGDDGQCWRAPDGETTLDTLCRDRGARVDRDGDRTRYTFEDRSVILDDGGGWDLGYTDCYCWQGAGHSDDCDTATDDSEVL
jgi:hypothetical protein